MKLVYAVAISQILLLGALYGGAHYLYKALSQQICQIEVTPNRANVKVVIVPKYKPSEHNSEAQHKFEASVKHTE